MRLDTQRLQTLDQIRQFLADNRPIDLRPQTRAEAYAFVAETLERFDYPGRGKADNQGRPRDEGTAGRRPEPPPRGGVGGGGRPRAPGGRPGRRTSPPQQD